MRHLLALILLALVSCGVPEARSPEAYDLVETAYTDAANAARVICPLCTAHPVQSAQINGGSVLVFGGQRYLGYSRDHLAEVGQLYGRDAVVGIFGHEWGHVIDSTYNLPLEESSADSRAGCILAIVGGDTEPLQRFLLAASGEGVTYATAIQRGGDIDSGFESCEGIWR